MISRSLSIRTMLFKAYVTRACERRDSQPRAMTDPEAGRAVLSGCLPKAAATLTVRIGPLSANSRLDLLPRSYARTASRRITEERDLSLSIRSNKLPVTLSPDGVAAAQRWAVGARDRLLQQIKRRSLG